MDRAKALAVAVAATVGALLPVASAGATPAPSSASAPTILHSTNDRSAPLRDLTAAPTGAAEDGPRHERQARHRSHTNPGAAQPDPVVQQGTTGPDMPATATSFDGVSNAVNPTGPSTLTPPDPNGEIGPNHYVQVVNQSIAVYSRTGVLASGFPKAVNALWSGFSAGTVCRENNDGDPVVLYDQLADRWFVTQLALPNYPSGPFYQCIAVSTGGDPTGTYSRYQFLFSNTKLNDYGKFAVWPDGYYASYNQFDASTGNYAGVAVAAYDRTAMLAGAAATAVSFDLAASNPNSFALLPSDLDGSTPPPVASPNYFVEEEDSIFGFATDRLQLFRFHVDFATPAHSTFTGPSVMNTAAFDSNTCNFSRSCVPQPGTTAKVDALSDRAMFRLAYRNFGDHESLVLNNTVDVDTKNHAGIRWYEVRNPGGTPTIYQQSTYAPDTAVNRWLGSIAMDGSGDVALGYSASSGSVYPSIRYAGRLATDPVNTLPQAESTLIAGSGSQTSAASRWGDYSDLTVDPVDDCTFWYTNEYYATTSGTGWRTRIGSFRFPSCGSSGSGAPDLVAGVTDSPDPVKAGSSITYHLTLANSGTAPATNVTLADTVPTNTTFQSLSAPAGFTCTAPASGGTGTVSCTAPALAAGAGVSGSLVVKVKSGTPGGTTISDTVSATEAGTDATPADNAATTTTSVMPSLSINDVQVNPEGGAGTTTAATFTVKLSGAVPYPVTVHFATASNTAKPPGDYTSASGTVTFSPGVTSQPVTVTVNGDNLDEVNETFKVGLSSATNALIADATGIATIVDDDPPPTVSVNDVSTVEGDSGSHVVTFTVSLSAASGKTVKVAYATAPGSATAGSDYASASGTLSFTAGQTTKTVSVTVYGDLAPEADETFTLNLSSPSNVTIADGSGLGTIVNDD